MKYYTGVGSREIPNEIIALMKRVSSKLSKSGWVLRSGGAVGADSAFESGANKRCEIYLAKDATAKAMEIAEKFHPAWNRCSSYAKKLHARNAFQVLGRNLNKPSSFLICWTPDGCISHKTRSIKTGGTGTAISIADHYNVPVFNLNRPDHIRRVKAFVS